MKCICQICCCGKHRCPHYMPNRPAERNKQPCLFTTEYTDKYIKGRPATCAVGRRPSNQIRPSSGAFDYRTTNGESYLPHENLLEYEKMRKPYKDTKPFENNGEPLENSVTQQDYKWQSSTERPLYYGPQQSYRPPSNPFDYRSTNQDDFARRSPVDQDTRKTYGPRPDNLVNGKDSPVCYDTTSKEAYVKHELDNQNKYGGREQVPYKVNQQPFYGQSSMKEDYPYHKNPIENIAVRRYSNTRINKQEPFETETTNSQSYKKWDVEKVGPVTRPAFRYRRPSAKMEAETTNKDYFKHFDEQGQPSRPIRPRSQMTVKEGKFSTDTSYSKDFVHHDEPTKQTAVNRLMGKWQAPSDPFQSNSESQEQYKGRPYSTPVRMIKRRSEIKVGSDQPFTSKSSYASEFQGASLPECPSVKIVGSNFKGYKIHDDFDAGHRFLEKIKNTEQNNNNANLRVDSPALPPIRQSPVEAGRD